jgi:predicted transcriptional regulator
MPIDLTPFGFTATETAAYQALLDRGPSSGYALAKSLNLARANVYQALTGLVAKGAALARDGSPQIYRAVAPDGVVARIARQESGKLDRLEQQIRDLGRTGEATLVPFSGERELKDLVLRAAARESGPVDFLAPGSLIAALLPVWRKREADSAPTRLWLVGEAPGGFPLPLAGAVAEADVGEYFGAAAVLLLAGEAAMMGRLGEAGLRGYWTSDPLLVGLAGAAMTALTGPGP